MKYSFHPSAKIELSEAALYYETCRIGQWTPSKTDIDRPLYHIFLIGNGLSLALGIGAALLIKVFIRN